MNVIGFNALGMLSAWVARMDISPVSPDESDYGRLKVISPVMPRLNRIIEKSRCRLADITGPIRFGKQQPSQDAAVKSEGELSHGAIDKIV